MPGISEFFNAFSFVYSFLSNKSLTQAMLESQRPLSFVIYKLAVDFFGGNVLAFLLLNFITTSLVILLVFLISKTLLDDVFKESTSLAFLVAIFFCVIFNIDQIFLWSVMFLDNIAYIFYLASFYFYINLTKKQHYLVLSIFSFLIAVFIYELGIFLPLLCFCYDIIFNRNWKKSLWFVLPLGIYGIIRVTKWFGLGWTLTDRNQIFFSSQFLQQYSQQFFQTLTGQISITQINILYGISGLLNLNHVVLAGLLILDGVCIFLIFKYVLLPCFSHESKYYHFQNAVKLFCIGMLGVLLSDMIIGFSGAVDTRHLIFIDPDLCNN
jgi:hypothetical protein